MLPNVSISWQKIQDFYQISGFLTDLKKRFLIRSVYVLFMFVTSDFRHVAFHFKNLFPSIKQMQADWSHRYYSKIGSVNSSSGLKFLNGNPTPVQRPRGSVPAECSSSHALIGWQRCFYRNDIDIPTCHTGSHGWNRRLNYRQHGLHMYLPR